MNAALQWIKGLFTKKPPPPNPNLVLMIGGFGRIGLKRASPESVISAARQELKNSIERTSVQEECTLQELYEVQATRAQLEDRLREFDAFHAEAFKA